jgi:uncharacterized protein (DUF1501 family)
MAVSRTCDGIRRRDVLRVGAIGATGLTLANYLRLAAAQEVAPARAKAGIMIYLGGGPSHVDTFDPKPDAPAEFRGEFNPIETNVPGIRISEHLPLLAQCADKYAILRGVSHTLAAHELGRMYINTGNRPLPSLTFPGFASVANKEWGVPSDLPQTVSIPDAPHPAGYLGIGNSPLATGRVPAKGQPFFVRGMSLGRGLTVSDVERRQKLLNDLDVTFQQVESSSSVLSGLDQFSEQAYSIISSKRSREAFDISKESAEVSDRFGASGFGQSCLLAARLVESGVRFCTVTLGGWDTHADNFTRLKTNLLPTLDKGVSALLATLSERGLLESTSVMVAGEFGRTPKINPRAGRDHFPRAMFVLMAGGGMKVGQVVGESDEKAMAPKDRAFSPDDVAATFYKSLGIDHRKEYHTDIGRPVMIVRDGSPIDEII